MALLGPSTEGFFTRGLFYNPKETKTSIEVVRPCSRIQEKLPESNFVIKSFQKAILLPRKALRKPFLYQNGFFTRVPLYRIESNMTRETRAGGDVTMHDKATAMEYASSKQLNRKLW